MKRTSKPVMLRSNAINQVSGSSNGNVLESPTDSSNSKQTAVNSPTNLQNRLSTISTKHYDSLVHELICPNCSKPMYAPILLCETGHSICQFCTKILSNCPICKKNITPTRSVTLEKIAGKIHFSCPNSNRGCTVRLPAELLQWHKQKCIYKTGICFMGEVWGKCSWSGCEANWIDHCLENHKDKISTIPQRTETWSYELCKNSRNPVCGYYIFQVFNETFNLYQIFDKSKSIVTWTMICACKDNETHSKYAYEVEIFIPNDPTKLLIQRNACHNENDKDILEDGQCINFRLKDVVRMMDSEKKLYYRVKLMEVKVLNTIQEWQWRNRSQTDKSPENNKNFNTSIEKEISQISDLNKIINKSFTLDKNSEEIVEKFEANKLTEDVLELESFLSRSVSQQILTDAMIIKDDASKNIES